MGAPSSRIVTVARALSRVLVYVAWVVVASLVLSILIEGFASLVLFRDELRQKSAAPPRERVHTRYDPQVGWINVPNLYLEDLYGPSEYLKTNSQSFRADEDVQAQPAEGTVRVICSGDSFTLGYGVSNENTWCQRLEALDPRLEAINLGQGGYGLDQSYLWYLKAALDFSHQLHVVAFITDDLDRMKRPTFLGYPKPVLRIEGDQLVTKNVPVPRMAFVWPWFTQNKHHFKALKTVQLFGPLYASIQSASRLELDSAELPELVLAVFEKLQEAARDRGAGLLLVYLPTTYDAPRIQRDWQTQLGAELGQRGIAFLDLNDPLDGLPEAERTAIFAGLEGHYTRKGQAMVGRLIYQEILGIAEAIPALDPLRHDLLAGARHEALPWRGEYYRNQDFSGAPASRWDADVDFSWGMQAPRGDLAGGELPSDLFSVRWTTCLASTADAELEFLLESDDGSRLYLDGEQLGGKWGIHHRNVSRIPVKVRAGRQRLTVEYFEARGAAFVRLRVRWGTQYPTRLPAQRLSRPEIGPDGRAACE